MSVSERARVGRVVDAVELRVRRRGGEAREHERGAGGQCDPRSHDPSVAPPTPSASTHLRGVDGASGGTMAPWRERVSGAYAAPRAAVAALLALALTACTHPGAGTADVRRRTARAVRRRRAVGRRLVARPRTAATPRPIRIALAGDVHFEGVLADRLRDPATALAPASDALAAADLTIVNLETSVGTGGRPEPGKRFTFSAGPEAFDGARRGRRRRGDAWPTTTPSTTAAPASRARSRAVRRAARADPAARGRRDRPRRRRGVRARRSPTSAAPRVATLAASVADQDPTADPTGQLGGHATTAAGIADALDPSRLLDERTPDPADRRRGRGLPALGHPGAALPEPRPALAGRGPGRRRGRHRGRARTPTGCRATAGWATATSPTAWATTRGTPPATPPRRARACCT